MLWPIQTEITHIAYSFTYVALTQKSFGKKQQLSHCQIDASLRRSENRMALKRTVRMIEWQWWRHGRANYADNPGGECDHAKWSFVIVKTYLTKRRMFARRNAKCVTDESRQNAHICFMKWGKASRINVVKTNSRTIEGVTDKWCLGEKSHNRNGEGFTDEWSLGEKTHNRNGEGVTDEWSLG